MKYKAHLCLHIYFGTCTTRHDPYLIPITLRGWSSGAMVLGKFLVPGRSTIWITVGQGYTALSVDAG